MSIEGAAAARCRFHNIFTINVPFGEKEVDSITFYWYNRPNETSAVFAAPEG